MNNILCNQVEYNETNNFICLSNIFNSLSRYIPNIKISDVSIILYTFGVAVKEYCDHMGYIPVSFIDPIAGHIGSIFTDDNGFPCIYIGNNINIQESDNTFSCQNKSFGNFMAMIAKNTFGYEFFGDISSIEFMEFPKDVDLTKVKFGFDINYTVINNILILVLYELSNHLYKTGGVAFKTPFGTIFSFMIDKINYDEKIHFYIMDDKIY